MRVTTNSFSQSFMHQLQSLAARQQRLHNQAATGQRVSTPADDPAAVERALALRTESHGLKQFQNNIASLRERATAAFSSLKAVKTISDRAGEIATLADGLKSADELRVHATEVSQLIQQAAQLLNASHRGSHLFAGTRGDQPPFVVTTDADGFVTGVTYQGNDDVAENAIESGSTLAVDVPGANASGNGPRGLVSDPRYGADFFNHLIALQNNLRTGDTAAIAATDRPALRRDEDNLIHHLGTNGAAQSRLETAASLASGRALSLEKLLSRETDADLTDTLVQLNQAQYAYQAALQSGSGIMRTSLLDYLR